MKTEAGSVPPGHALDAAVQLARIRSRMFGHVDPPTIGDFQVLRRVGAGGMGVVYAAWDPALDRSIAVKLLHPDRTADGGQRLQREAVALARLRHPNVVNVHAVGIHQEQVYLAMEYIEGPTLRAWMRDWSRAPRRDFVALARVFEQAAEGLAAAHDAGLVHRDFKPDNVMIDVDGRVRLMDFGLARQTVSKEEIADWAAEEVDVDRSGLATSTMFGTPAYMAPEQLCGEEIGPAADQYAFMLCLVEALTGESPGRGSTRAALAFSRSEGTTAAAVTSQLPRWAQRIVRRGLCADPSLRWPSMHVVATLMSKAVAPRRVRATTVAVGVLALGAMGAAAVAARDPATSNPCEHAAAAMESAWNPDKQAELAASFAATKRPYAARAWESAAADLEAYAAEWIAVTQRSCLATAVERSQSAELTDRRAICLDRRLAAFSTVLTVLGDPNAAVVRAAGSVVEGLPELAPCSDSEALLRGPQPNPAQQALQREFDTAQASWLAGRTADATRILESLSESSEIDQAPDVLARVDLLRSRIAFAAAQWDVAADATTRALASSAAAADDRTTAEIYAKMVYEAGVRGASRDRIETLMLAARASLLRIGSPASVAYLLESGIGMTLGRLGDFDAAATAGKTAVQIVMDNQLGERSEGQGRLALAQTYLAAGATADAAHELELAERLLRRSLGAGHPALLPVETTRGQIALAKGDLLAAERAFTRSAEGNTTEFGRDDPRTMRAYDGLAGVFLSRGEFDKAIELDRTRAAYERRVHGEQTAALADTLSNLGVSLQRRGDYAEAVTTFREALAIEARIKGEGHLDVLVDQLNLASVLLEVGDTAEGLAMLERVVPAMQAQLGPAHLFVAAANDTLAVANLRAHRLPEAQRAIAAASDAWSAVEDAARNERLQHWLDQGAVHLAAGDPQAADAYEHARIAATALLGEDSAEVQEAKLGKLRARLLGSERDAARAELRVLVAAQDERSRPAFDVEARLALADVEPPAEARVLRASVQARCTANPSASWRCAELR